MNTISKARKRILEVLDENSFIEIGAHVMARATDFNLGEVRKPTDGVITGYGTMHGRLVYVYSQDESVLHGTIGEMHAKKIVRVYELAMKMGAPVVGFLSSYGLRLREASDALHGLGEIYLAQTRASGVIPQITAIVGVCGGGLALVPSLSDFSFIEKDHGQLFINSPNVLSGNTMDKNNTASANFQSAETGIVDAVGSEAHIISEIRRLIDFLPSNNEDEVHRECTDDLNRICEGIESYRGDTKQLLKMLSDDYQIFEMQKECAKEMVIAFISLNGYTVGAVANRTQLLDKEGKVIETYEAALSQKGCEKAASFMKFCNAYHIPILTVTNTSGFVSTIQSEKGIAKAVGEFIYTLADATVPKVNLIIGESMGSAAVVMNGKSIGADICISWPDTTIGTMEPMLAAKVLYEGKGADVIMAKAEEYKEKQTSVGSAARRGYVDHVIEAKDTRKYLIGSFEMLYTKSELKHYKKHGTV
ncbi:MAG: carboxyl transferase domain-containing protein [Lachnospiraceae bacterium]